MCEGPTCGVELNELSTDVSERGITIFVGRKTFSALLERVAFRGHRRVGQLTDVERALICAHLAGFVDAVNVIGGGARA